MITVINFILAILFISYTVFYLRNSQLTTDDLNIQIKIKYIIIGFITNFFDFFGIGSYAPQTLFLKKDIDQIHLIPGTMTVANYLPIVIEAFIMITIINVDVITLITLPTMAALGSYFSVKLIKHENSALIYRVLIGALSAAGILLLLNAFNIYPFNNIPTDLNGLATVPLKFILACFAFFLLGALQTFGLGIYAPGFAVLGLLGVSYTAILPINMLSSVLLTTSNSVDFIKNQKFVKQYVTIIGISGILGVLFASYLTTIIDINNFISIFQILVAIVVFFTAFKMYKTTE